MMLAAWWEWGHNIISNCCLLLGMRCQCAFLSQLSFLSLTLQRSMLSIVTGSNFGEFPCVMSSQRCTDIPSSVGYTVLPLHSLNLFLTPYLLDGKHLWDSVKVIDPPSGISFYNTQCLSSLHVLSPASKHLPSLSSTLLPTHIRSPKLHLSSFNHWRRDSPPHRDCQAIAFLCPCCSGVYIADAPHVTCLMNHDSGKSANRRLAIELLKLFVSSTLPQVHRQLDMSLVEGYSDEDRDTIQADTFGISDLPITKKSPHRHVSSNIIHNRTPSIKPCSSLGPQTCRWMSTSHMLPWGTAPYSHHSRLLCQSICWPKYLCTRWLLG